MKLSEQAATLAIKNEGFLVIGDATHEFKRGDVIPVTERVGLKILRVALITALDAPAHMLHGFCRKAKGGYQAYYSDFVYEYAEQAALAQMLNDAGEGFDIDDLLDIQSLDAHVTVIQIKQVNNYGHKHTTV